MAWLERTGKFFRAHPIRPYLALWLFCLALVGLTLAIGDLNDFRGLGGWVVLTWAGFGWIIPFVISIRQKRRDHE